LRQQDYWDSVNLQPGGGYEAAPKAKGFQDLLGQLKPGGRTAEAASDRELPYQLLRRVPDYEVRRYPLFVAVSSEYENRGDAMGTMGVYTNGSNEEEKELTAYVPALMSIPKGEWDQYRETTTPAEGDTKVMRWPMAVPVLGQPNPPKPGGRVEGLLALDVVPSVVVAVRSFSDATTEPIVRGNVGLLRNALRRDGIQPGGTTKEEFRLAQFDALNSLFERRNEVWVTLDEHPWSEPLSSATPSGPD
jgi:hypothetical protein